MSVTLHIIKSSLTFTAIKDGQPVTVAYAPFAAMANDYGREEFDYDTRKYKKNRTTIRCDKKYAAIQKAIDKGFNPDFVVLYDPKKYPEQDIFTYDQGRQSYCDIDQGSASMPVMGTIKKIGKQYYVTIKS